MTVQVKICGLTRIEDAVIAVEEGASFIGLVFVPGSPRCITAAAGRDIAKAARSCESAGDSGLKVVGVFRNQPAEDVRSIAEEAGLDLIQLHGDESDEYVRSIGMPVIKSVAVGETMPRQDLHPTAAWLLFDTVDREKGGGTGRSFDWTVLTGATHRQPFFLAGGLNAENVGAAISLVRPDGIDVSSGVEDRPGIKSKDKIRRLFERVRRS